MAAPGELGGGASELSSGLDARVRRFSGGRPNAGTAVPAHRPKGGPRPTLPLPPRTPLTGITFRLSGSGPIAVLSLPLHSTPLRHNLADFDQEIVSGGEGAGATTEFP